MENREHHFLLNLSLYACCLFIAIQMTTNWTNKGSTGCTESHSVTSATAPVAGALIALMLEAWSSTGCSDFYFLH